MDTKPCFKSRAFIGGLISVLALILDKNGLVHLSEPNQQQLVDIILTLLEGGGGTLALYGRVVASQPLSLLGSLRPRGQTLSVLLTLLVVGIVTLPLGACTGTVASVEAGIATASTALDAAGGAVDKAGDAIDNLKYRALKRELALACAKDIDLLARAADDAVWPIAGILITCPKIKAFVERGSGAVSVTVNK